jgi:hypothetical protein
MKFPRVLSVSRRLVVIELAEPYMWSALTNCPRQWASARVIWNINYI